jgi:hypothetical protein
LSFFSPTSAAVQDGLCLGIIKQNTGNYYNINFKIKAPSTLPSGKHLRIVLTWDSSPSLTTSDNALADFDLVVPGYKCPVKNSENWGSWESNVEVADIPRSSIKAGSTISPYIRVCSFTIPAAAVNKTFNAVYYAIAWTWVKDHAD